MKQAHLRFYEELNDYLPGDKKKSSFVCRFEGELTAARLLHAIGVPLSEIDLLLCNGEAVDPMHAVCDGDRISVYPVFESFDIKGVTRAREEPLRQPRFLAGSGLQRLAVYLRLLGFDTHSGSGCGPIEADAMADSEGRILLTRDDGPAHHASRLCRVRSNKPRHQAAEVLVRLDLHRLIKPFDRCTRCNEKLEREGASWHCNACGMVCPGGRHLRRMHWLIGQLSREGFEK